MKIEHLSPKFWDKKEGQGVEALERPHLYPHLEAIAEEVFRRENEIGAGNYSEVFEDKLTGLCCKRLNPLKEKPLNSVHQEAEFLEDLYGISEATKVPRPLVSMDAYMKTEEGRMAQCKVLIMETIRGANLEEVLNGTKELPANFDVDTFFAKLKEFIGRMHEEKGIYHRDIADRNVMVEFETGMPVLIDFGNSVYFSADALQPGDKDAYGHVVLEQNEKRPDLDLERLIAVEQNIRQFLTTKA